LLLAEGNVGLSDLSGTVAGADVGGHITIGIDEPIKVGGELSLGALHLPAAVGAMIGVARLTPGSWPTEPFDRGLIGSAEGSIKVRIGRVSLSPQLSIADMRGVLQLGQDSFSLEEINGTFAGGRIAASVSFERGGHGVGLDGHVRLAAVDLAELILDHNALTGRATIDLNIQGTGRSAIALVGSMKGDGTFTVQDGSIMHVNPSVFAEVIRSVDEGLPIDAERIRERTETALGTSALSVGLAQGEIVVAAGQLRLANTAIRAKGAGLDVRANVDLSAGALDVRLVLAGAPGSGALEGIRPEIALALRGPYDELKRALDVATFANWLALRAIDEKDKRINALQTGREIPVRPPEPAQPDVTSTTTPAITPPPAVSAPPMVPARPVVPAPTTVPAPITSTPVPPPSLPKTLQRSPAAKVLPPTDIRPPPATRPQSPPKQAAPTSRSWLERLLNP
jgi:large subunit ribosomal protein L24